MSNQSNPYVGPQTFQESQAHLFFGRELETRDLLSQVISGRLTLFYAQSGAGKSSLLNTRIVPTLRNEKSFVVLPIGRVSGELPTGISDVENIFIFNLIQSMDQAKIVDAKEQIERAAMLGKLTLDTFSSRLNTTDGLHFFYDETMASAPESLDSGSQPPHILIIDQFEEILTTHPYRWQEREQFFLQLAKLMQVDPKLWVLLTLREDYVAQLEPYSQLVPGSMLSRFYMQRMGEEDALKAVKEPAAKFDRPFSEKAAVSLVNDLRLIRVQGREKKEIGQYVEPVQLQVVCYELWEKVSTKPQNEPINQDDIPINYIDKALGEFYEDVLRRTKQKTRVRESDLRGWFERELITPAGTRGIVFQDQELGQTKGLQNEAVLELDKAHIIRGEIRAGSRWYELTHDRFIEPIQKSNEDWRHRRRQNQLKLGIWLIGILLLVVIVLLVASLDETRDINAVVAGVEETAQFQANSTLTVVAVTGQAEQAALLAAATREMATAIAATSAAANATGTAASKAQATANFQITVQAQGTSAAIVSTEIARATIDAQATTTAQELLRVSQPVRPIRPGIGIGANNQSTVGSLSGFVHDETGNIYLVSLAQFLTPANSLILQPSPVDRGTQDDVIAVSQSTFSIEDLSQPISAVELIGFAKLDFGITTTTTIPDVGQIVDIRQPQTGESVKVIGRSSSVTQGTMGTVSANMVHNIYLPSLEGPAEVRGTLIVSNLSLSAGDLGALVIGEDNFALGIIVAIEPETLMVPLEDVLEASGTEFIHFGQIIARLEEQDREIEKIVSSPDGRWLASVSKDRRAIVWDLSQPDPFGGPAHNFDQHPFGIWDVEISPDSNLMVTAGIGGYAYLWHLAEENPEDTVVTLLANQETFRVGDLLDAEFSADGAWLAISGDDTDVYLWDLKTDLQRNAPTYIMPHDTARVSSIRFSPDGHWLAAAKQEGVVLLWDLTQESVNTSLILENDNESPVHLEFSPDGRWLAVGGALGRINLWDTSQSPPEKAYGLVEHQRGILDLAFSPDNRWLASGSTDGLIWDLTSLPPEPVEICSNSADAVRALAFSPDNIWLAMGDDSGAVLLRHLEGSAVNDPCIELGNHDDPIRDLVFASNGTWLASGGGSPDVRTGDDRVIRIWQIE